MMRSMLHRAALALALLLAAAAARAEKITIAALTFVSSSPLFIAQEKGYYAEEGLEVEFAFFRAAQPVAVAIASGDADFGVTAFTAGFFNLAGQGALKVIGAQSREEPGFDFSSYLVSNRAWEAGFQSPEQFPGHSLGMTQYGSSFHLMIGLLADRLGFPLEKVRLVPLQKVPNMIAAIKSGQVDSIILPAHITKPLAARGEAHIIGWVHQYTPYQLGGLFTSTANIEQRRATVEKFVRAYQKAATDYHEAFNQLDAQGRRVFGAKAEALVPIIQKYTKASREAIFNGAPYIDPLGRLDVGSVYEILDWYKKHGLVDASVEASEILDLSFIDGHFNIPGN